MTLSPDGTQAPGGAVIYLRLSLDRTGEEAGVTRQREDCERRCRDRGWPVLAVEADNDMSASKPGRRRPGFEAMLAHIASGRARYVVAWHLDRLQRNRRDELRLYDLCRERDITVSLVRGPDLEWQTPTGRYLADNLGALARMEVEIKSDRQRRANEQKAAKGLPAGGRRPFGYTADQRGIAEGEAAELRAAADAVIGGTGLWAIQADWNARGIRTTGGGAWDHSAVRRVLTNPRYAGRRIHRGVDVGPAVWPAIFDDDTAALVRAVLTDPSRARKNGLVRYLLSTLMLCGACGGMVYGTPVRGRPVYGCHTRRHVAVDRDSVDRYVIDVLAARLSRDDAVDLFTEPTSDVGLGVLRGREEAIRGRMDGLAQAFAALEIDRSQLASGTARLRAELEEVTRQMAAAAPSGPLADLAAEPDMGAVVRRWAVEDRERFRAVLDRLAVVKLWSPGRGARFFREESVTFEWRRGVTGGAGSGPGR